MYTYYKVLHRYCIIRLVEFNFNRPDNFEPIMYIPYIHATLTITKRQKHHSPILNDVGGRRAEQVEVTSLRAIIYNPPVAPSGPGEKNPP